MLYYDVQAYFNNGQHITLGSLTDDERKKIKHAFSTRGMVQVTRRGHNEILLDFSQIPLVVIEGSSAYRYDRDAVYKSEGGIVKTLSAKDDADDQC